jgi:uncharacterized protein (UPF0335 family)
LVPQALLEQRDQKALREQLERLDLKVSKVKRESRVFRESKVKLGLRVKLVHKVLRVSKVFKAKLVPRV